MPNFTLYGGRKQATTNFSLSKLECGPQEMSLHLKFSERLKETRIHFKSGVFAAVAHPCGPVNGPGVLWGFSSDSITGPISSEKFLSFQHSDMGASEPV